MPLAHEQPPARLQQRVDDGRPAIDARQPADRTDARVDEVEPPAAERARRRRTARTRRTRARRRSPPRGSAPARAREARSRGRSCCAPSRASESVSVPMWHCRWTPRSPAMSPRRGRSKRTTPLRKLGSSRNRCDRVVGRGDVRGDALIPVGAVDGAIVGHRAQSRIPSRDPKPARPALTPEPFRCGRWPARFAGSRPAAGQRPMELGVCGCST